MDDNYPIQSNRYKKTQTKKSHHRHNDALMKQWYQNKQKIKSENFIKQRQISRSISRQKIMDKQKKNQKKRDLAHEKRSAEKNRLIKPGKRKILNHSVILEKLTNQYFLTKEMKNAVFRVRGDCGYVSFYRNIMLKICGYLDLKSLNRLSETNWSFYSLVKCNANISIIFETQKLFPLRCMKIGEKIFASNRSNIHSIETIDLYKHSMYHSLISEKRLKIFDQKQYNLIMKNRFHKLEFMGSNDKIFEMKNHCLKNSEKVKWFSQFMIHFNDDDDENDDDDDENDSYDDYYD